MPPFLGPTDNIMKIVQVVNTVYFMNLWDKFIFNKKSIRIITMNPRPLSIKYLKLLFSMNTVDSATAFPLHPLLTFGDRGSTVVKVLYYISEGRWFDSRWCHWIFPLT
jgi:hypothetical protein